MIKKLIIFILAVSTLISTNFVSSAAENLTNVEELSIDKLTEELAFFEMDNRRTYQNEEDRIVQQIESLGSEVCYLSELPDDDPLKKCFLDAQKGRAEPNWSTTTKTLIVKTGNTYNGKIS